MTTLRWGSATDVGAVRESNQDSLLVANPLFAVADGMGGHLGGEVASATALEILEETFASATTKDELLEAVRRANAKVWDKGQLDDKLHGMGTTLTAIAKITDEDTGADAIAIVNVGDSRTYLIRNDDLRQLTLDHSFVEEMVRSGELSPEEAETHPKRNIVTRALGVEPTVQVDLEMLEPQPGDRLLLCSDGLTRELNDGQIAGILRRLKNPDEAARELVSQAKAHGGHDNISVVIVDVEDDGTTPVTFDAGSAEPKKLKKIKTPRAPRAPRPTRLTLRVVLFFTLFVALVVVACGSVVWYARASYFVGLQGQQLVIYRGRPDKVLWFKPTVAERTTVNVSQILRGDVPRLQSGATQTSLSSAEKFVQNLTNQAAAAQQAQVGTAATTTSTTVKNP